jgi:hypothetical protein
MLVINSVAMMVSLFARNAFAKALPEAPNWLPIVLAAASGLNLILTVFLFRWQRWAFYVFCGSAGAMFTVNLIVGLSLIGSVVGLLGPVILYWALQIGKEDKGWPQLK